MSDFAIEVKNVTKSYNLYDKPIDRLKESLSFIRHKSYHKPYKALNDLSFEVKKGECFGIIGTNGSGKSTILKIITDVLNPTTGNVIVNGRISALLELGAGFNLEYTGIENIHMNGMILGYSKEEVNNMIPAIEEFADIGDFINQPVKLYSSGMFARLAFAVAINVDPDILIVDEALSVGDIFFQAKCYKKFDEFKKMGKTILFVTHDMSSVLKYCDRVMVLNKGDYIDCGDPAKMVNIYKKILSNTYVEKDKSVNSIETPVEIESNDLWKSKLALNPKPNIYGNMDAEIIDFGVFDDSDEISNTIRANTEGFIRIKAHFNKDVANPIFAWKIKNAKGLEISGTNTMYEGVDFGTVLAGTDMTVKFSFKLPLATGQYVCDFSITHFVGDELEVICRNYEITTIDVVADKENVGFVNPRSNVSYKRSK